MTTKTIFIGPEKFTIFDSDISDSESETDEWISVSTSTTMSTMSTLPSHLNLNPRTAVKTRPQPTECGVPHPGNPRASSSPTSSPPAAQPPPPPLLPPSANMATAVATNSPPPSKVTSEPIIPPSPITPREPPITFLKRFLPILTAIYIVSPTSRYPTTIQKPVISNLHAPFSTLTALSPNPPISIKATRLNANLVETYIRICAACAKPPMTIYCDGTWVGPDWVSAAPSPCPTHISAFQSEASPIVNSERFDAKYLTCGKCTHMSNILNCLNCARKRDATLFQAVIEALSLFRRVETESLGVDVFDMSVPVAGEVYRHVEGCKCVR